MQTLLLSTVSFLLIGILPEPTISAQQNNGEEEETVNVDFPRGVQLSTFINLVSRHTNKRFIYNSSDVQGKVTIIAPKKIPKDALFQLFLSVLQSNGLVANREGLGDNGEEIWKIVKKTDPGTPHPVVTEKGEVKGGQKMVSKVFRLQHANAKQAQVAIANLVSNRQGGVMSIKAVNSIIVTDYAPNINRISRIIDLMDRPVQGPEFEVVQLEYAAPSQMQQRLQQLVPAIVSGQNQQGGGGRARQSQQPKIVADPATRSLIITAMPEELEKLKNLIDRLDQKVERKPSQMHLYRLDNSDAETIAGQLSDLLQQVMQERENQQEGQTQETQAQVQEGPSIVPVKSQNAIMVSAKQEVWDKDIKPLLDKLDRRRAQILLNATIVEVSGTINKDVGTELGTIDDPAGDPRGFGFSTTGLLDFTSVDGDEVPDLRAAAPAGGLFGIFKDSNRKIPVMLKLFQSDQIVDISQLPYIVTNDNQEASLSVKEEVPIRETSQTDVSTTENVRFEEAGLELIITPHIAEENYLRLDVESSFDQFTGESQAEDLPPQKTTREIQSLMTVPDRQTVIMGGLTSRVKDDSESGIPFLKEIPGLGFLFRRNETESRKTTLYIFLTPYILRDKKFRDLRSLTRPKKQGAEELTGLDFGESDDMVGPGGALDSLNLHSPYTKRTREDTMKKFEHLFKTSPDIKPDTE